MPQWNQCLVLDHAWGMSLRVALADDEPLPRERLERLLREAGCTVEAVFESGTAVLEWFRAGGRVDALFLDVQMPGPSGLELLAELEEAMPTVMVTAFAQHALGAFEHGAVDYLLKPVTADRLARTLLRLQRRQEGAPEAPPARPATPPSPMRFAAKAGEGMVFLELKRVTHFELDEDVVWAWVQAERYRTTWASLAEVEAAFPGEDFLRIQRHLLLRPSTVVGLRPLWGRRVSVRVAGGQELDVSRSATPDLKAKLGA